MISDAVIRFVGQSIRAIFMLVPTWEPPANDFGQSSASVGAMAAQANGWFPVAVVGWCLVFIFALKVFLLAWRVIVFIYHQVWGSN